jgi:hypothetical protein
VEEFTQRKYLDERERYYNIVTQAIESYVQVVGYKVWHDPVYQADVDQLDIAFNNWCRTARKLPIEMVRSRRNKGPTKRYLKLMEQYKEYTDKFDGCVSMFVLKYRH